MPPVDLDLLDNDTVDRLRAAFTTAGYTVDGVVGLLGSRAHGALLRDATVAGLRATAAVDDPASPLAVLTRLWPLQAPVREADVGRALPGLLEPLVAAGVLARSGNEVRAAFDLRPYADDDSDWWVASDLTPGFNGGDRRVDPDHVLGVSPASTTLAQLAVRQAGGRALDLGTGCGVQALHLARHASAVVCTDVNPRALAAARLTARLSGVTIDRRAGSLWEPVAGESFDLIITNPPYVVSPATDRALVYRDSGLAGDEVVRRIVVGAAAHLAPDGWCQVVANWAHRTGEPWQDRVTGWLAGTGCDAWVLQREVLDPAEYVEMWLADAGLVGHPEWHGRYDRWLAWMDDTGIEAIGLGWLSLRRTDRERPVVRVEHWPYDLEQPMGPEVAAWGRRVDALAAADDADLLAARPKRAVDVVQETYGEPGAEDPQRIVLRRGRGVKRARPVDTVEAAFVGACDGDLQVGQALDALAVLLDSEPAELRAAYRRVVRELVEEGWLTLEGGRAE